MPTPESSEGFARVEECFWSDGSRRGDVCKVWAGDYFIKYCDTKKESDEEADLINAAFSKDVQPLVEALESVWPFIEEDRTLCVTPAYADAIYKVKKALEDFKCS